MTTKTSIPSHYKRIISKWPVDILRPHISFQDAMRSRLAARYPSNAGPSSSSSPSPPSSNSTPAPTSTTYKMMPSAAVPPADSSDPSSRASSPSENNTNTNNPPKGEDLQELQEINTLYTFLENRYQRKYPLQASTLKPTWNPGYYEALLKEMEEAPKRGAMRRWFAKWRGWVRWQ